ncbi:MAG: N-acetylmuramoyl-L-alanine amidase, partial [Stackebrandtia sp.]
MTTGKRVAALLLAVLTLAACTQQPSDSAGTPSESTASAHGDKPLDGKVVSVDPGHNGGNADHPEVIEEEVDVLTGRKACNS